MYIESRKELKGLLDWYDELKDTEKWSDRRKLITYIYQRYKTTTFNVKHNKKLEK